MIKQAKSQQTESVFQSDDNYLENIKKVSSVDKQEDVIEITTASDSLLVWEYEQNAIADLAQETIEPQKRKKSKRSLLRWVVYSVLGFGTLAMVLPSFLSCGNKAISSEGRTYVGTMNRGQQAFWIEKAMFGQSIAVLQIGILEETTNYRYEVQSFPLVSYQYAIPKNDKAKSFVGAVFVLPENSQDIQGANQTQANNTQLATFSILCESPETGVKKNLPKPFLSSGKPTCAEGTRSMN